MCSIGHVGAWSFCQDKIMATAGDGGMVASMKKMGRLFVLARVMVAKFCIQKTSHKEFLAVA